MKHIKMHVKEDTFTYLKHVIGFDEIDEYIENLILSDKKKREDYVRNTR
jgi:hypothetical protein